MLSGTYGDLLGIAKRTLDKYSAVDAAALEAEMGMGDPAAMGGGAAMGDPAAMGMGDPAAMGGGAAAPPPPPPGISREEVMQMIQQTTGGGVEPIKPKIDVNVALMQILKILAKLADAQGIPIPAADMVATQDDLTQFGMQQGSPAAASPQSAIQPPAPIGAASPELAKAGSRYVEGGQAFGDAGGFEGISDRAAAMLAIMEMRRKAMN